jgi:hypothetical protein
MPGQEKILVQTFGRLCYVYNWALRLRTESWYTDERVNYAQTSAQNQ